MPQVLVSPGPVPGLLELLERHPGVVVGDSQSQAALAFHQGTWSREILIDRPEVEPSGLIELMDNNPLVCADRASVPGPAATLALIAFGPLIRADSLIEPPALSLNFAAEVASVAGFLTSYGWAGGLDIDTVEDVAAGVCAGIAMARIRTPKAPSEIDDLYDEAYGRSFYVRRSESGSWNAAIVAGHPFAAYRLRFTPGEGESLLTIQVQADPAGKCGAAQIVHMMNVMAGFEETLGID